MCILNAFSGFANAFTAKDALLDAAIKSGQIKVHFFSEFGIG